MAKHKIAPRELLKRQGNFWQEGDPLTEKDMALLQIIKDRAKVLGYTPLVSDVPEACKIKARFRCWKHAIQAAELPSERAPEQVAIRTALRVKAESQPAKDA